MEAIIITLNYSFRVLGDGQLFVCVSEFRQADLWIIILGWGACVFIKSICFETFEIRTSQFQIYGFVHLVF